MSKDIPKGKTLETIGLGGDLSAHGWLFSEMKALEYLNLSFNYFYGGIPALDYLPEDAILPKARYLSLNLNRLTGELPSWILNHKYLACWNPFILVFNQEGYDNTGKMAGFSNAPASISQFPEHNRVCPDNDEAATIAAKLPALTKEELKKVPLHGNWRYYKMLNKEWYLDCK